MLPFRVLHAARRELLEAAHWFKREDGLAVAREFGAAYRAQLQRARQLPRSGHLVAALPARLEFEVRRFLFERFAYALYVAVVQDELVVLAVAHQHRRPRYWIRRLAKVRP